MHKYAKSKMHKYAKSKMHKYPIYKQIYAVCVSICIRVNMHYMQFKIYTKCAKNFTRSAPRSMSPLHSQTFTCQKHSKICKICQHEFAMKYICKTCPQKSTHLLFMTPCYERLHVLKKM